MFNFVDDLVAKYDPQKQTAVSDVLTRLGVTTGLDTSPDQYGNQEAINSIYDNVVWAYRCIAFIASNLAQIPWIYKKNDKDVDIELDIFLDPNPMQTRYDFLVESISRLLLQGEMYWELYRASSLNNKVIAIFPDWRSEEVTIIPDKKKYNIAAFKRMINGKEYLYKANEVFYIKYFNPFNPLRGMGPLRPARHAAAADLNAVYYNKQFFKQGARPAGVLTTDQKLTDPEQRRLEEYIKKKYQSVDQMHELLVLWGGLEFKALNTMSMTDMQFQAGRLMSREEIISAFGLSLEVMGLGEKTYENVRYYRRLAWTETLIPLNNKLLALFNKDLVEELYGAEGLQAEADYSGVDALREERSKKVLDYEKGFKSGALTPNEIREDVFDKDPLPDPKMDLTYLPVVGAPKPDSSTSTDNPQEEEEPKLFQSLGTKRMTFDDRTKIWHLKVKYYESLEPPMLTFARSFFKEVITEVKKRAPEIFKSIKAATPEDPTGGGFSPPPGSTMIFDKKYWQKRLEEKGGPIIFNTMEEVARNILNAENLNWDPVHPYVRQILGQRVSNFSTFVSNTTEDEIKRLINLTLQETADLSIDDQAQALDTVFDKYEVEAKAGRAKLIARTETMGAANAGTQMALVQGKFGNKMWITSRDDKVRDSHQIDGQVVTVDSFFKLADGREMLYPDDFNERCIEIATLEPATA